MPLTFEEAGEGKIDDIRNLRDVVDFGMTRGCSKKTWRDMDAAGGEPQRMRGRRRVLHESLSGLLRRADLRFEKPFQRRGQEG